MGRRAETATTRILAKKSLKSKRGFTLIEMTVVITILALMAAAILPNIVNEQKSREARQFFSKARNLMLDSRSRSISDGQTRSIKIDETSGRLIVETIDAETGDAVEGQAVALPDGVTGDAYRVESEESNSSEWAIRFYADGKARKGGISFNSNGRIISLVVDERGSVTQVDGPLPEVSDESWDAGGYEQRI